MGYRIGSGYIGTDSVKVSTGNQNIIPDSPSGWTIPYKCYKFSFLNYDDCTIKINGGSSIFLKAEQGFDCDIYDALILEFIIVESGVNYQFLGAY